MEYLYHRVPPHMVGKILYPLNQLKDLYPDQYAEHVKKYEGREKLLTAEVPPLHCLWNDVLHMTAVSPAELKTNLALAGIEYNNPIAWFKIPIDKVLGENSIAFTYRRDKDLEPNLKDYEIFDSERMSIYRTVPNETIEYYREMKAQDKHPLLFHLVPHILYKGTIDTEGLEIVDRDGMPVILSNLSDWKAYFENTKNSRPRKLLVEALPYVTERNEALDLGSGALNDVKYLIFENFKHITAVDSTPAPQEIVSSFPSDIFSYEITPFDKFNFPEGKYDLINAQYALPFNPPESFNTVFASILTSLKIGGVFTGQLFGVRDEWNVTESNKTFHTKEKAEKLLSDLKIISFKEEETDERTVGGIMKHWHVFHFIAIKK